MKKTLGTFDFFFSYSNSDRHIARELAAQLKAAGMRCFMAARDIPMGKPWMPSLRNAIRCCDRVLLLITPRSKESTWVTLEIGAGWMEEKELIPLLQFVEPEELRDIAKDFQVRIIETDEQKAALVSHLKESRPKSRLSFPLMLSQIASTLEEMDAAGVFPDTIVCSGRAGAVCGGIIAHLLNTYRLKLISLRISGRGPDKKHEVDTTNVSLEDINGRQVLVVEWRRNTGRTFKLIEAHLHTLSPSSIHSFALYWTGATQTRPDFHGFKHDLKPLLPWSHGKEK